MTGKVHIAGKPTMEDAIEYLSVKTTLSESWNEKRMDIIGQNDNDGDHYAEDRN